jgi:uncharacterized repeat protein (TIGR01451 family)
MDDAIKSTGGDSVRDLPQIRSRVITLAANARDAALAAYAKHAAVERAEPAHVVVGAAGPNDPAYAQQWALPKIAWDVAYSSTPVIGGANIAVLDTGVDAAHPDLAPRVGAGHSFVGGVATTDPNGHGTALAGIAAASVNNLVGMAGVAYNAPVVTPVQVLHSDGTGLDSDVVAGVLWAADNGAKVILMGFSSPDFSAALQDAVNYAWNKGAVLVAATGNGGSSAASYPAGMANVIGVASTDQNDAVANSNTVSAAVGAPGVGIYATLPGATYGNITGTSAAAAETAGLAALLVGSGKTNTGASAQIRGATDPIAGRSFGRINVAKALTTSVTPTPSPAPSPTPTPGPTPTYKVGAAGVTTDFRQCAENETTGTVTGLGNCHWINGALITSNSEYFEGMSVPQRTIFLGVPATTGNTHTLTFHVQFTKGGVHGYDWLVSYNQAVADALANGITLNLNPCGPEIGPPSTMAADCTTIRAGPNSLPVSVPGDPFVSKDGPTQTRITAYEAVRGARTIKIYGDASITAGLLTLTHNPSGTGSDTGDSDIDYTLTWTSASTKLLIEMAGHLAVSNDGTADSWGVGLGASFISGGPYHFSLDNLDGKSLGSQDNQIQAGAIIAKGTVSGVKFNDLNANHVRDTGEPGLSGWQIRAYLDSNGDGTLSASEAAATPAATTTTDSNGAYSFTLSVGSYVICEVLQTGWTQSAPTGNTKCAANTALGPAGYAVSVTCCPGSNATGKDFGNFQAGAVSGQKFNDLNTNGVKDTGEPGLSGWTIRAYVDANGNGTLDSGETTVAASAVTDSNGNYSLSLTPGTYVICEVLQSGWTESLPSNTKCSAVSGLAPGGYAVTVTATPSTGKDFGNFQSADVHIQKTGNGPLSAGQTATYSITVSNAGPGPAIGVAVSDMLPPGTWTITAGAGWTCPATASGNFSCTLTGNLAAGATTEPITVSRPTTTADCGTLTNNASVTASNESLADQADNSASATISVQCADVHISKTGNGLLFPGQTATFTLTVSNAGPNAATGVVVTDSPLPPGTWTVSAPTSAGCPPTATGSLTCTFTAPLPANASVVISFSRTTSLADCGSITNANAHVSATNETTADQADNDSGPASITVQCADVHISKTGNGPIFAGQTATFTITVSNAGPGPATGIGVSDTLPAGTWTITAGAGWTCPATATGTFSCTFAGTLAAGSTTTPITVSRDTTTADCGTLTNNASVSATNESPADQSDNSASASIAVQCADVHISKTGNGPLFPGDVATFTITVSNAGPGPASGISVTDTLPAGTWTISAGAGWTCPATATGSFTCTFAGTLAAGATTTPISVSRPTTTADCGTLTNGATVSATNEPPADQADNSASASIAVQCADVHISKTGNGPIFAGQTATFTITVSNAGPGPATGISVSDTLPAGTWTITAGAGWTCPATATGTFSCTFAGTLASGATTTPITVSRPTTTADCGTLTNSASVSATNEPPADQTDNTASASIAVQCADVHISKSGNGPLFPGDVATFTITVSNAGPGPATGISVTDALPAGTWTITAGSGWTCPATATGSFTCTFAGALASGATTTITVSRPTTTADCGTLTNSATVSATNEPPADQSDNSASASIAVQCADVHISKTGNGPIFAGQTATFSITVSNAGPGPATGVSVTDTLPGGTWTITAGAGWTCPATATGSFSCTFAGTLASGATTTPITVSRDTTTADCGTLTNSAAVSATNEPPADQTDNSASASIAVQCADVHISKTGNGPVFPGDVATFTINVSNAGPGPATGISVTDTLPAGTWTITAGAGWTCPATATGSFSCTFAGTLASGATTTPITVSRPTTTADCGTLTNSATVSATNEPPADQNDNTATASIAVQCADVHITKTGNGPIFAGDVATFAITVNNAGPGPATGISVTDTLPAGTWTIAAGAGWTCPATATGSFTCTFAGTLASGATTTPITVSRPTTTADCGTLTNSATVSATNETPADQADNSASASILVQCADVHISKSGNGPVFPGDLATFAITVSNAGPGPATGVSVTDTLPAGTWTITAGAGWTCPATATGTFTCTFAGTLAAGATTTPISVSRPTTTADCGTLTNSATVSATNEPPADQADNSASASIAVQCADVHISKTGNGPIFAGQTATFAIAVSNAGPGPATGISVTDTLPAGTWTITAGAGWTCPATATGTFSCTFAGTLAAGATTTPITVSRDTTTADCGTLTNSATVSATNEPPADQTDNTASASIAVQCADVHISKTGNGPIFAGQTATFTITVSNAGPGPATGVSVTDTLPTGTWTIVAGAGWTCPATATGTFTCTFAGTLAAGATTTPITVSRPTTTADCGTLTNSATVSATNEPPADQTDNTASASIAVQCADVHISKTGNGPIFAGQTATFSITVSNAGPGPATGISVTDTLPAGTWTITAGAGWTCPATATGTFTCTFAGTLAAGATTTPITVSRPTTTADCGTLTNSASVSATNEPPADQTDNTASASIAVQCADVHITKTGNSPLFAGQTATFTITVSNAGPGAATGVVVTDTPLPPGTWTVSAPPIAGCPSTATGSLICTFTGTLAAGASVIISLSRATTAADCGTIVNPNAHVSATNEAPANQTDNDSGPATIVVSCGGFGFMTGGGEITATSNGGKSSFGFNARGTPGGTDAKGHFNYLNHVSGLHINGDVVQIILVDATNHLMRFCVKDGSSFYTVETQDNGEPGTRGPDRLSVSNANAACNPVGSFTEANHEGLKTGNIQWHPPGS